MSGDSQSRVNSLANNISQLIIPIHDQQTFQPVVEFKCDYILLEFQGPDGAPHSSALRNKPTES